MFATRVKLLPSSAKAPTQLGCVSLSVNLHNTFLDPQSESNQNSLNLTHSKPYLNETSISACWRMPYAPEENFRGMNDRNNEGMKDTHSGFLILDKGVLVSNCYSIHIFKK